MNPYIKDCRFFLKYVSKGIKKRLNEMETVQLSLNAALGFERLMKGLLYDINPTFILIEPVFKHSMKTFYAKNIIPECVDSNELAKNPNEDVITLRNSILRVQHISKTCFFNKNLLFNLSESRDIIVHNELKKLKIEELKTFLKRDFYPLLLAISKEHKIDKKHFFENHHIRLSTISSPLQKSIEDKIDLLLESHLERWNQLKTIPNFIDDKIKVTKTILKEENKEKWKCPACKNDAILYLKPLYEFDQKEEKDIHVGSEFKKLKCQYCKLDVHKGEVLSMILTK